MPNEPMLGALPSGWRYTTLAEACALGGGGIQTGPFGSQLHKSDYVAEGVPSIMPTNIGDNRINTEGIARVKPADAQRLSRYLVSVGDIVYSRRGDVEKRALIREPEDGWLCGTGCLRVRLGSEGPDPQYTSYYLGHPAVRAWIVRHAHGATMPNLNTSILGALPLIVPPRTEQKRIGEMLGRLDDKIELNRRMSETLDEIARVQFNETFLGTDTSLSTESQRVPVLRFFEILSGGTPKTSEPENWDGPIPWFSVADTPPGSTTFVLDTGKRITERGIETSPAQVVPAWTTVISARGTVGKLAMAGVPLAFNQSCYGLRAINGAGPSFVFLLANHIVEKLKAFSHGSVFSTITRRTFDAIHFPCPSNATLTAFEDRVAPLYQRILVATHESAALAELRDTLLPKLISGELRIPEAEQLVSEVA